MGSRSGFDAVEDCFEELTSEIHALETGLSSDPAMNWRVTGLDRFILVSNSDAHSASKLGREANIFDSDFSYDGIFSALADVADKSLTATIEFFPEEGKYHYDGHAGCQLRWHPDETARHKGLCSVCGKPVTVGVMNRVGALARRPAGQKSPRARPFHRLVPLAEVIAASLNVGPASKKVSALYTGMLTQLGPELGILMHAPVRDIATVGGEKVAAAIGRVRTGEVDILPGYDGEYGTVRLLSTVE
jgi:uncharacterized protein (TIGR00375 family)